MMLLLLSDVAFNLGEVGKTDRECPVAVLPTKFTVVRYTMKACVFLPASVAPLGLIRWWALYRGLAPCCYPHFFLCSSFKLAPRRMS